MDQGAAVEASLPRGLRMEALLPHKEPCWEDACSPFNLSKYAGIIHATILHIAITSCASHTQVYILLSKVVLCTLRVSHCYHKLCFGHSRFQAAFTSFSWHNSRLHPTLTSFALHTQDCTQFSQVVVCLSAGFLLRCWWFCWLSF